MKTIDEKELQKTTEEKRVTAKWFCCAFKILQLVCKGSFIFKLNLELALLIILKQR